MSTEQITEGAAIKRLRQSAHLTQEQLAERMDSAPAYVSRVESGKVTATKLWLARATHVLSEEIQKSALAA